MSTSWDTLRIFFDNDDGSLPEIHLKNLNLDDQIKIMGCILPFYHKYKNKIKSKDGHTLPDELEEFVKLISLESLLMPLNSFNFSDSKIPISKFSIHGNDIELVYHMGKLWNSEILDALINFFKKIKSISPSVRIELANSEGPFFEEDILMFNEFISKLIK